MGSKTVKFNKDDTGSLPTNKPVMYKIFDGERNNIYTGSAKRGG